MPLCFLLGRIKLTINIPNTISSTGTSYDIENNKILPISVADPDPVPFDRDRRWGKNPDPG
jgi:hypothetical protein